MISTRINITNDVSKREVSSGLISSFKKSSLDFLNDDLKIEHI